LSDILIHPNPFLNNPCAPVTKFGEGLKKKEAKILEALQATSNGIGLAANQIGLPERIAIAKLGDEYVTLINPEIVNESGEQYEKEGCLSLPGMYYKVKRAEEVTVKYQDIEGNQQAKVLIGIEAVEIQHEVDHLNGMLFFERLPKVKRADFQRKYKIMLRKLKKAGKTETRK